MVVSLTTQSGPALGRFDHESWPHSKLPQPQPRPGAAWPPLVVGLGHLGMRPRGATETDDEGQPCFK